MQTMNEVQSIKALGSEAGGIAPLNRAAGAVAVTGIDRTGFQSCQVVAFTGAVEGAPDPFSWATKLQDNTVATAGDGGWADADACGLDDTADLTTLVAINVSTRKVFNLLPAKQFIRVHGTVAFTGGATPKFNTAAVLVLGGAVDKPVTL